MRGGAAWGAGGAFLLTALYFQFTAWLDVVAFSIGKAVVGSVAWLFGASEATDLWQLRETVPSLMGVFYALSVPCLLLALKLTWGHRRGGRVKSVEPDNRNWPEDRREVVIRQPLAVSGVGAAWSAGPILVLCGALFQVMASAQRAAVLEREVTLPLALWVFGAGPRPDLERYAENTTPYTEPLYVLGAICLISAAWRTWRRRQT